MKVSKENEAQGGNGSIAEAETPVRGDQWPYREAPWLWDAYSSETEMLSSWKETVRYKIAQIHKRNS